MTFPEIREIVVAKNINDLRKKSLQNPQEIKKKHYKFQNPNISKLIFKIQRFK